MTDLERELYAIALKISQDRVLREDINVVHQVTIARVAQEQGLVDKGDDAFDIFETIRVLRPHLDSLERQGALVRAVDKATGDKQRNSWEPVDVLSAIEVASRTERSCFLDGSRRSYLQRRL